jgi:hypothetical protein
VPLLASFEYESAVQADCLSKSTMRLVAHELVNNSNISDILYWPSFEIFRWAGSQSSNYFAADDGAAWHVSEEKVAGTIKAFVEMFAAAQRRLAERRVDPGFSAEHLTLADFQASLAPRVFSLRDKNDLQRHSALTSLRRPTLSFYRGSLVSLR